jgi:putative FmdB family regulatory protein
MPTYEYKCALCSMTEVHSRNIDDRDQLPTCRDCNITMDRIWQATPTHFKGGGFYSTGG